MSKPLPVLASDAEAESFVGDRDLSQFDLTAFKPHGFEFGEKSKQVNMRLATGARYSVTPPDKI
ncbi:MAG: CopG family antitoxin [Novosphingobium sp.]